MKIVRFNTAICFQKPGSRALHSFAIGEACEWHDEAEIRRMTEAGAATVLSGEALAQFRACGGIAAPHPWHGK
jgi:hypothetical protein